MLAFCDACESSLKTLGKLDDFRLYYGQGRKSSDYERMERRGSPRVIHHVLCFRVLRSKVYEALCWTF
ncbi:hypothetical protein PsYK624_052840 [Phanerochaete sordida]|uniref:Uncharacterized protein n=1 Tax=Phanerochaete sordida TaxID=48140 RepID=A0A9P3G7D9_9APHY|nr:hypothetical protein PsYK624_052840 [Phanerochaete sordida]